MGTWGYVLLCLLLPMVWGLVVVWVMGRIEKVARRKWQQNRRHEEDDSALRSPEYHI